MFWSLLASLAIAASIATAQSPAPSTGTGPSGGAATTATPNAASEADQAEAPFDLSLPNYTNELRGAVDRLPLELDRLRKANERLQNDSAGLAKLRQEIDALRESIGSAVSRLTPLLPTIQSQIDRPRPAWRAGSANARSGLLPAAHSASV
ncbi:MAG: hypothetical protein AAFU50_11410, partial [Pseudomonadota bacterium]